MTRQTSFAAEPKPRPPSSRAALEWWALAVLGASVLIQAHAYGNVLPLSLGPRVVMQPWLMTLPGHMIYEQIADQHTPLMPLVISWLVPLWPEGWRLASAVLVALLSLSTVLTWWAARRAAGPLGGLLAAVFFVCWTGPFDFGKLWHESFLTPLYAVLLVLFQPTYRGRSGAALAAAGVVCGIAFLVKQQAALVLLAFVGWNLATGWRARRPIRELMADAAVIGVSALVPLAVYGVYHGVRAGTLANLWYWAVEYNLASRYASLAWLPPTLPEVREVAPAFALVPVAVFVFRDLLRRGDPAWETAGWGLLLAVASCVGVYPRYGAFHLQPLLPVLAWLSAMALVRLRGAGGRSTHGAPGNRRVFVVSVVVVGLLSIVPFVTTYRSILDPPWPRVFKEYSDLRPLATEVTRVTGGGGSLYVFPDDEATANLYYLLRTPPPRFWIFAYPWYMTTQSRQRILRMLDGEQPRWVVRPVGRWETDRSAPDVVAYINDHYNIRARLQWAQGAVEVLERGAE